MMALALLAGPMMAQAQPPQPVLQRGYDANVSGANLTETILNTSNVGPNTFGLLFNLVVDDRIYAQPLYVPNVAIPNQGTHNVVYVATMNDTVYAFDADKGGKPLWSVNLAALFNTTAVSWPEFSIPPVLNPGNLGILSTPVIDPSTNVMYVVACDLEAGAMAYRLHALDITTGEEPYGPGVLITGSYGGATFNPRYQNQRASLVLADNQVVFGFASLEQEYADQYTGWLMAYNKTTLQQSGAFATVTTGNAGGGIWQSGRPPAVDGSGHVYVFVGNGFGGGYDGVYDFSESVLKLDPSQGLALIDWFTPGNWSFLDSKDLDVGSAGPMLIPGTNLLAGGGKTGILYVLNTANLGKWTANDSGAIQEETITDGEMHGGPVFWNRPAANGGPVLYDWGVDDVVQAYPFNGSTFASSPSSVGTNSANWPGGMLALSANGGQSGSGVLWATTMGTSTPTMILHAFDATNLSNELWNNTMVPTRDDFGNFSKFDPPLIANGKVYVPTFSSRVAVYGLGVAPPTFTVSPTSLAFGNVQINATSAALPVVVANTSSAALPIASIMFTGANANQFSQVNTCAASVPVGSNCTISVTFAPTAAGGQTATLNVKSGSTTKTTALSGTGTAASFTVLPASLAFGNVQTGTASAAQPVTVTNNGAAALPITSIAFTGANPTQYSQTNNCGTSLAPGSNCVISVVFAPTSAGSLPAALTVDGQTVALSGTGVAPSYTVLPASLAFGNVQTGSASAAQAVTVTNNGTAALPITIAFTGANPSQYTQTNNCGTSLAPGSNCAISVVFAPTSTGSLPAALTVDGQSVALSGTGTAASFTVLPASLAFGNVAMGSASAAQPVTVTNTGTGALPITSIALTGANPTQYSETNNCGTSLTAGSTCTISVVFAPTSTGSLPATLTVNGQSVALTGTGTAAASFTVLPASLAFGNEQTGTTSAAQAVTVTNRGSAALSIVSITLVGVNAAQYAQTNTCGTSVPAGSACTISVVFAPTSAGSKPSTLSVNAGPGTITTVALSGQGVVPFTVLPASLAFGNEQTGTASAAQAVTVTNSGGAALPITSITLVGVNAAQYAQTNTCGTSVPVGSACTISVVFSPTATGSLPATLSVNAGPGTILRTTLSGTGIAPH
jgi:hypothetical protein